LGLIEEVKLLPIVGFPPGRTAFALSNNHEVTIEPLEKLK